MDNVKNYKNHSGLGILASYFIEDSENVLFVEKGARMDGPREKCDLVTIDQFDKNCQKKYVNILSQSKRVLILHRGGHSSIRQWLHQIGYEIESYYWLRWSRDRKVEWLIPLNNTSVFQFTMKAFLGTFGGFKLRMKVYLAMVLDRLGYLKNGVDNCIYAVKR